MFISIDIGPLKTLIDLENELEIFAEHLKFVDPQNIHLTLLFLGDTDIAQISLIEEVMQESVRGIEPFLVNLKGVGVFPDSSYIRVIWVGLNVIDAEKNILETISQKIRNDLPIHNSNKNQIFKPHITIARVKKLRNKTALLKTIGKYTSYDFGSKKIDSINLKKSELTSQGPIYETLATIQI